MSAAKQTPVASPVSASTIASTPASVLTSASTSVSTPVVDPVSTPGMCRRERRHLWVPSRMSPSPRLEIAVLVKTIRTLLRRSVREVKVMQLEALAITSEQRDATRTDDTVREPWMPSERVIKDRYGAIVPPNPIPLYIDNRIVADAEAVTKHFVPETNQRRDYYISLLHELRYWSSKKTSGRSKVAEWQALCQSRNQFVANFNNDPSGYRERISSARERFAKYSVTSAVQRVHEGSCRRAFIACTAPLVLLVYTTNRVPANVKELRAKLACTRQHPSVVPEHNTPRNTAPRSVTPPVRGGLRTTSPFPERPSSGRFGETTYLEGDPIVSNEYENEPDLGSSSD
ncbi:hypothetical protein PHMEG_00013051 [Phytophthora megakarya]|uniref:Uncharacterized protein n=1 Tax=Phytophthora megakarya TaxID=4795 RepID=A0A225W9U3_9STRA|nr:hypothetical protein PHMEG_00013051 [Phytophthora megakarya]